MLENVLVAVVVRDRAEQLNVRAQAKHPGAEVSALPDALHVVALEVVRDRCGTAVAA